MATSYGYTYEWTDASGSVNKVHGEGFSDREEARAAGLRAAKASGWTEPKWWQWWRINDYPRRAPDVVA